MTPIDKIRTAIDLLAEGAKRWGSDTCGCDACARKRNAARREAVVLLASALRELDE